MLATAGPFSSNPGIWIWTWDPSIIIGLALWTLGYIYLIGPLRLKKGWEPPVSKTRQLSFHLGSLVLFFALVSPLDHLSDVYLLSAHMIQHLLLVLVVPPLWLIGIPNGWLDDLIPPERIQSFLFAITRPLTAFIIFNGIFSIWHIPSLYDAALYHEGLHILEHLAFIGAAILGWWPILGFLPKTAPRASYPIQLFFMFFMMFPSTVLGAIITFAHTPLYPFYIDAPRVIGSQPLPFFVNAPRLWGLSVMDDQQLAGLIMWVPGNMIYFLAMMVDLNQWYKVQEKQNELETDQSDSELPAEKDPEPVSQGRQV